MKELAHLYRLLFSQERFISVVTEFIVSEERVKSPSVLQSDGEFPIARRVEIQTNVRNQTTVFRRGLATGMITTAFTIAVGATVGSMFLYFFGEPTKALVYLLQAVGASVILGATLAEVGGDIMTWSRKSILEQLNKQIFRGLYVLGTFLFVLSFAWDA
ncbi:MAG: hypothetical protein ACOH1Q_01435 [Thiobacillus sp.]